MTPEELIFKVSQCFCEQLALSIGGAPAACCVVSSDPVIPNCCAGFAWVRITGIRPVAPQNDRCIPASWALEVELGISRCAPPVCGDGAQNPCCDNEAAAVNVQMGDWAAMVRALGCCLLARPTDPYADYISGDEVIYGSFRVDDPGGGCVTVRMDAAIKFWNNCSCD